MRHQIASCRGEVAVTSPSCVSALLISGAVGGRIGMLEYLGEEAAGRQFVAMDLTDPPLDFSRIAASFGVKGARVEHPDQIGDAVREAQTAQEPWVVDIVIDGDIRSRWL